MTDQEKLEKADKAISHILKRVKDDSRIWYYIGYGSESYSRLTEAYGAIHDIPVERVEVMFTCTKEYGA